MAIAAYVASWTFWFWAFTGGEFQYYFRYLRWAWTGPGEIVAFIQLFTLGTMLAVGFTLYVNRAHLPPGDKSNSNRHGVAFVLG